VRLVHDAAQVHGVLTAWPPHAVLLDLSVRGAGHDLLTELRAVCPRLPIIVITGRLVDDGLREDLRARGAFAVYQKPADLGAVRDTIRAAVETAPPGRGADRR
jgi:DNA-binding NtrC family response regulator